VDCFQKTYCWSLARDHAVARPRSSGRSPRCSPMPPAVQRRTVRRGDRSAESAQAVAANAEVARLIAARARLERFRHASAAEDLDVADRRCWRSMRRASRHAIARRCCRVRRGAVSRGHVRRGGGDVRSRPRARRTTSGPAPTTCCSTGGRARWTVRRRRPRPRRARQPTNGSRTPCVSPPSATRPPRLLPTGWQPRRVRARRGAGVGGGARGLDQGPADP